MLVGYARVSTEHQSLSIQLQELEKAGCGKVFKEKRSGTSASAREALGECLDFVRDGDSLVVTRIDRLARSLRDLQNIVHDLQQKGVSLVATEQPVDTSTAAGKCFLDMLGVFAEFETSLRKERQMEGIERAKKEGKYKGRKPVITDGLKLKIAEAVQSGEPKAQIAKRLGIGRATLYRAISEM